jgi:hypothetical protein
MCQATEQTQRGEKLEYWSEEIHSRNAEMENTQEKLGEMEATVRKFSLCFNCQEKIKWERSNIQSDTGKKITELNSKSTVDPECK